MKYVKNKEERRDAFAQYITAEIGYKRLTPEAAQTFNKTYGMLGVQEQAPRRRPLFKSLVTAASTLALCVITLSTINIVNPAYAEALPIVGPVFAQINSSFKQVNSTSKSPVGTNLGTYSTEAVNLAMTPAAETPYQIDVAEAYSDGEYVHASLRMTAPAGTSDSYAMFFTMGSATVNGERCESGLFSDGGIARFLADGKTDTYTGTVAAKLPAGYKHGDTLDFAVSIDAFYGIGYSPKDDHEMQLSKGYGKSGDDSLSGLEVEIPVFTAAMQVTVNTAEHHSFSVNMDAQYNIQAVDASASKVAIDTAVPAVEGSFIPVQALYTQDGLELARNSDQTEYPFEVTGESARLVFDGIPKGTTALVLRWYTNYDYGTVLAEYTINLTAETVTETQSYQDEMSPLYLRNPAYFTMGTWNPLGDYFAAGTDEVSTEPVEVDESTAAEQWKTYEDRAKAAMDYQNGLGLRDLWIRNGDENYIALGILSDNDYRDIEVQVYNGGTLIASEASYDGVRYTEYAVPTGFFDERHAYFGLNDPNQSRYYDFRIHIAPDSISADDTSLTVKVTDRNTGEVLLDTVAADIYYQWGVV